MLIGRSASFNDSSHLFPESILRSSLKTFLVIFFIRPEHK